MKREIQVESFVRRQDGLRSVETLPAEEREAFACWLKTAYLNELFRGQGVVLPQKEKS